MRSRKNKSIYSCFCALIIFCLYASGCGYTTHTVLPGNARTVYVDIFKNDIDITKEVSAKDKYEGYSPGLETDLRDAIVSRIFLDGHLKVKAKPYADSLLEGEITQYRKDPLRYQDEVVEEYRLTLVCDFRLLSKDGSGVLLEENNFSGDTTYFTTGALEKSDAQALADAYSDLATKIVNRIIENW